MPNTIIKKDAVIEYAIVGEDCVIGEGTRVGKRPETVQNKDEWGVAVVGHNIKIPANEEIPPKAMIKTWDKV
jgi:glucose-1-phosphate adenylyltransferase